MVNITILQQILGSGEVIGRVEAKWVALYMRPGQPAEAARLGGLSGNRHHLGRLASPEQTGAWPPAAWRGPPPRPRHRPPGPRAPAWPTSPTDRPHPAARGVALSDLGCPGVVEGWPSLRKAGSCPGLSYLVTMGRGWGWGASRTGKGRRHSPQSAAQELRGELSHQRGPAGLLEEVASKLGTW